MSNKIKKDYWFTISSFLYFFKLGIVVTVLSWHCAIFRELAGDNSRSDVSCLYRLSGNFITDISDSIFLIKHGDKKTISCRLFWFGLFPLL